MKRLALCAVLLVGPAYAAGLTPVAEQIGKPLSERVAYCERFVVHHEQNNIRSYAGTQKAEHRAGIELCKAAFLEQMGEISDAASALKEKLR